MVCKAAGKAVEKWSREVFPNIRTREIVELMGKRFGVDYGLVKPEFKDGLANFRFLGEITPIPKTFNPKTFPFSPSPMPSTARSKHVYLVMSDFVGNTLLYSLQQKGMFRQSFSASEDSDIRDVLEMICKGLPIKGDESSNDGGNDGGNVCADLNFSFNVLETPMITFSKAEGISLGVKKAEVHAGFTRGGQTIDLLKILISIKISAKPGISADGRQLHFSFGSPEVTLNVFKPTISTAMEQQVQSFVRMAGARYGQRALNKFGSKGLRLPNVGNKVDIVNRELSVEDGAIVIAADLKSNL
jgi:hypothetical protein